MPRRQRTVDQHIALTRGTSNKIQYAPRGAALELFHSREDELLLAGPAGTGKSLGCLQKSHLVLSKYPNSKGFMARKTRTSMTNSCLETYNRHVLTPLDKVTFHTQDQQYNYPNGSMFAVIGLDKPDRIMSTDWDFGFIQEATECTENDVEMCTTRLRNWVVPYQQLMMDCNPDRPTHWLKKRCDRGLTKMMLSFHKDNPRLWNDYKNEWTQEGKKYLAKLERLSGARRSRLYLGQWVSSEGMVYTEWNPQIHMVTRASLPPEHVDWPHYWSIDWGFTHPFVWQDWIENPQTGALYLLNQIYRTGVLVEDVAKEIVRHVDGAYYPRAIVCDHDAGDRAVFERHTGLATVQAYKSINVGVQAVKKRLSPRWGNGPGLFICYDSLVGNADEMLDEMGKPTKTEDEIDGYVWDKKIIETANSKKDEIPVDMNNHGCDAKRYIVAFVDSLADDPEDFESVLLNEEVQISPY